MKQASRLLAKYRFASEVQKSVKNLSGAGLTYYKDGELVTRQSLILKKTEDIEAYVIKTIQNYYRTTYKQGIFIWIQDSIVTVFYRTMDSTPWIISKSQCNYRKI